MSENMDIAHLGATAFDSRELRWYLEGQQPHPDGDRGMTEQSKCHVARVGTWCSRHRS